MEFYVVEGRNGDDQGGAVYDEFYPIAYFKRKESADEFMKTQQAYPDGHDSFLDPYEYRILTLTFED